MKITAANAIVEVPSIAFRGNQLVVSVTEDDAHDSVYVISVSDDLTTKGERGAASFTLVGEAAMHEFLSAMSALQRMRQGDDDHPF